jgi:hypothetical protein
MKVVRVRLIVLTFGMPGLGTVLHNGGQRGEHELARYAKKDTGRRWLTTTAG